jgi:hypothetical protein
MNEFNQIIKKKAMLIKKSISRPTEIDIITKEKKD